MQICNKCNATNSDVASFCCNCGSQLISNSNGVQTNIAQPRLAYVQQDLGISPQGRHSRGIGFVETIRVCLGEKYSIWLRVLWLLPLVTLPIVCWELIHHLNSVYHIIEPILVRYYVALCLVSAFFCWPYMSVSVRKLPDSGHSGWWIWVSLVPVLGVFIFIAFALLGSQNYDNEYGKYV